jgi:hypothetical protein
MATSSSSNRLEERYCQLERLADFVYEPRQMLQPIDGYDKVPLVSLENVIKELIGLVPDIERRAYIATQRSLIPKGNLTPDESAAICLFTMNWESACVYTILNQRLQSADRCLLKPFFSYLKLLLTALWKSPSKRGRGWRYFKGNLSREYHEGDRFVWWGFSHSVSTESFLSDLIDEECTLLSIECLNGKIIRDHSYYETENEMLLMPAISLIVTDIIEPLENLHIIAIEEIKPPYTLLESPFSEVTELLPTVAGAGYNEEELAPEEKMTREEDKLLVEHSIHEYEDKTDWMFSCVSDNQMKLLANELETNTKCQELTLTLVSISTIGICYITQMLKINKTIKHLDINLATIFPIGFRILCEVLKNDNKIIQSLDLSRNENLTDDSIVYIANMLKVNTTLKKINLQSNNITDVGMLQLCDALQNSNRTVKYLFLNKKNRITDASVDGIIEMIKVNKKFKELHITDKRLTIEAKERIREETNEKVILHESERLQKCCSTL